MFIRKFISATKWNVHFFICAIVLSWNCHSGEDKKVLTPESIVYKIDTASDKSEKVAKKPPILNITDTIAVKQIVLCMKDSARSSERIGLKLSQIYGKTLLEVIKKNKIVITGPKMAWFKTSNEPFYFEAGIPVNKIPAKMPKNVFIKNIGGDSVLVAHFYGPYELTYEAYGALREWMTDHKKKASGIPYEIYVGEPIDSSGKANDPYRVQTDIVFPHH
jgi:effector-binding domain-containing protein